MSYWSHHPEAYDAICNEAVARYLMDITGFGAFLDDDETVGVVTGIVEYLQDNHLKIWNDLLLHSQKYVIEGEREYWDNVRAFADHLRKAEREAGL